jgi:hypothetical protein
MPHEAQRFTHARAMGRDAQSDQLVHLSNLVPSRKLCPFAQMFDTRLSLLVLTPEM